ncbi:MAG: twin-arginine translocation signal domain-containing protein [Betaproteobacteria bacterium]|nr:twin-arginine translocation signal domain-containing protein [Betaproteobacteria bacterium]
MPTRRQFLKVSIAAGAVLAGAGWLAWHRGSAPFGSYQWLDERSASITAALVPAVLEGALPTGEPARREAVRETIEAFDRAVSGLSPAVQKEIAQLFSLLGLAAGRFIVAGVRSPWAEATGEEVTAFLKRWRTSRFGLLRAGYQALTQLIIAAWYGNPASWARIAYPGPPTLESGHS